MPAMLMDDSMPVFQFDEMHRVSVDALPGRTLSENPYNWKPSFREKHLLGSSVNRANPRPSLSEA
jgi:hypothetical protein